MDSNQSKVQDAKKSDELFLFLMIYLANHHFTMESNDEISRYNVTNQCVVSF